MPEIDPGITDALDKLAMQDPVAARLAAPAIAWLTGGGGAGRITQERVQRFCWYDLPLKWQLDFTRHQAVTSALSTALDLLGLPRYAQLCRSEVTTRVHRAYEQDMQLGLKAFREANLESGIYPVDLPELRWGAAMGIEEASTLSGVQDFLELAVATAELIPGSRGWRSRQAGLVRSYLTAPNFRLGGQTPLDVVLTERIQIWINVERSELRRRLLSGLANRLLHPGSLPEDIEDPYPALTALLRRIAGDGADGPGGAPNALDREAGGGELPDPVQVIARNLRLIRRRQGRWLMTRKGLGVADNPLSAWSLVPGTFLTGNPFHRMAGEILLARLMDGESVPLGQILSMVTQAVAQAGYREAGTGMPPGSSSVRRAVAETLEPVRALGLLLPGGGQSGVALNPAGKATALEALRLRATGPAAPPWQ